ncbi:hypothetical protein LK533_10045 [Sphingomonas sp. PL-96]|uniref:hypothetical protein n=1 Tax=Sphingomonas sp. PL-96 TaxID=2887201 RepID=UPI001E3CD3A4|nr:hypothetical protein [Sphingomonas sp. PL-96]MCC2977012.1 hypothetical protein [Sphingomonas sp. PL-96]
MDLSFARLERGIAVTALPVDLAVLLARASARQAASVTARVQARVTAVRVSESLLSPRHGAFHPTVAEALRPPAHPLGQAPGQG